MLFILSLIPIALILLLMLGFRWGAAQAGGAGYLSALLIAVLFFGTGPQLLGYAHVRALLLSLDVLFIIWAAFLFYRVADEAGAVRTIGQALPHLTSDRSMQALIIAWAFASFLQGVGGFGVPVAVISPILVSLGFAPLQAVIIPSIGHGWAVTFGSLGSSFQALMSASGLPAETLTPYTALFLSIAGLGCGLMVAHAAGGWKAVRRLFWPVIALGLVMGIVQYAVACAGMWNIASFAGGMAGLLISFPIAQISKRNYSISPEASNIQPATPDTQSPTPYAPTHPSSLAPQLPISSQVSRRTVILALSGYAILVIITLAVQLIPAVKDFLGQVSIQLHFPQVTTALGYVTPAGLSRKIRIFSHAGATLTYASVLSYLIYRRAGLYQSGAIRRIVDGTLRRVMSSSVSIASMVAMAVVMENGGMTDRLARGLAERLGAIFPLIAPWIGALGAFMTGSNTNSNVVFGALQLYTAQLLGLNAAIILAAQTAGASLASVMAPTKIVVGTSTAGMAGHEGEVMRKLLIYVGLLVLLVGVMTIIATWLIAS